MGKEAKNIYPIHEYLRTRWSARAFTDQPVEKEKLQSLFEAARWSPSMGNEQPWHFIAGLKADETWQKIFSILDPGNQDWCKNAPVLMISVGRSFQKKTHKDYKLFRYDTGQSVAHMTFEAVHLGLIVHQMAGFSPEKATEIFEIPEEMVPLTAIAVGYLGDPSVLAGLRQYKWELAERERKPFEEFVFSSKFGTKSNIIE